MMMLTTIDEIMIAPDYLKHIAAWSRDLSEREIEIARVGISEKSYRANEYIFMRGDEFEYWTSVVTGLARMGIVSAAARPRVLPASPRGPGSARVACSRTRLAATT